MLKYAHLCRQAFIHGSGLRPSQALPIQGGEPGGKGGFSGLKSPYIYIGITYKSHKDLEGRHASILGYLHIVTIVVHSHKIPENQIITYVPWDRLWTDT